MQDLIYKAKHYLLRIINPFNWIDSNVDWEYDKYINDLLDSYQSVKFHNDYKLQIRKGNINFYVWIKNYPYAYGDIDGIYSALTNGEFENPFKHKYASIMTRKRIRNLVKQLYEKERQDRIAKINQLASSEV